MITSALRQQPVFNRGFIAQRFTPLKRSLTFLSFTKMTTNGNGTHHANGIAPKITLYTNHQCPYAHRAHIALKELDLPYEEVIIDLDRPRDPWYLEINPRGLVPSIKYSNGLDIKNEIITESAIVAQFLADSRPSHLAPASMSSPTAPLVRARMAFIIDTWNTKVSSFMYPALKADEQEKEAKAKEWVAAIEKEIEPLLKDADPFFGGSKELTMVEVNIAPFLIRIYALANGGLLPKSLVEALDKLPNFSKWAKATIAKESVTYIWDEENVVSKTAARIQKMKAAAK